MLTAWFPIRVLDLPVAANFTARKSSVVKGEVDITVLEVRELVGQGVIAWIAGVPNARESDRTVGENFDRAVRVLGRTENTEDHASVHTRSRVMQVQSCDVVVCVWREDTTHVKGLNDDLIGQLRLGIVQREGPRSGGVGGDRIGSHCTTAECGYEVLVGGIDAVNGVDAVGPAGHEYHQAQDQ